ncbi:MAG TPA: DUF4386 domain-containing protein [Gemmatimonadaceae bacterium]|nr:DUF4386 domain-containing protein [Gemmatimonadaceae bacterium]
MNTLTGTSPKTMARATGALYLVTIIAGIIAQGFISTRFISSGNGAATAGNILANSPFYTLGFSIYMIEMAAQVAMTALFYELLKPVNKSVALLSAVFGYTGCGVKIVARLFYLAPLLMPGGSYSGVFSSEQQGSIVLLLLRLNDQGAAIALIFFGFSTLLKGWLVIKSTFLPKWLGVLSFIGGIGWLAFLSPQLGRQLFPIIAVIGLVGSLATIAWLLVVGVNEEKWLEQSAAAKASIWA